MTPDDYVNSVVGKPWVRFGQGPDEFDCYGLVVDSFDKVDGITIAEVAGYTKSYSGRRKIIGEQIEAGNWRESQPCDGAVMVTVDGGHVGRCLCGGVLHTNGNSESCGKVVWQTYRDINQQFRDVKYYAYSPGL